MGIITKVTVKLIPLPPYRFDVLAIYTDPRQALHMVPKLMKAGIDPTSVEYMDNSYVRGCADYCHYKDMPHYDDGIYVIITVETFHEDELDTKMDAVCTICEESGAAEVLEADDRVWNMRRNCQTSVELQSKVFLTDDVVVPVHKIAGTIEKIMDIGKDYPFEVKINAHIGDGNLHIVLCKMDMSDEEWEKNVEEFHQQVYAYAYSVGGRLAGEHGIGAKKLKYMEQFTPKGELKIMKTIKRAMDPKDILNPGKVIDA
ncbi:putative glycolate oxidase [Megasphaera elsdenii CAG:570]|uniref:Putative glycolate oxidase n=1 Tax=Megasphaera elsdenii CAG:570 TaxID=1263087 RepID=R7MW67_MEGEL|nr:putative glycolate oxidase [Megasphaera elsdenii CAG:570]